MQNSYESYNFATEIDIDKRKAISYHKPLLHLVEQQGNFFIIPGASVSLIGQAPLYLYSDKIILFKSSSINEDHEMVTSLAYKKLFIIF